MCLPGDFLELLTGHRGDRQDQRRPPSATVGGRGILEVGLGEDGVLPLLEQIVEDAAVSGSCPLAWLGGCDLH
jgi:hypothetical protein